MEVDFKRMKVIHSAWFGLIENGQIAKLTVCNLGREYYWFCEFGFMADADSKPKLHQFINCDSNR